MVCKTYRGLINKEMTEDGRESPRKNVERQIGIRKQTKTKIKRAKKKEKEIKNYLKKY